MMQYHSGIQLLAVVLTVAESSRIQSIDEALVERDGGNQRYKRAANNSRTPDLTVKPGVGVLSTKSLVFRTPCLMLETTDIALAARAWTQPSPWNLSPLSIANASTIAYHGVCASNYTSLTITFSNIPKSANVSSAKFSMGFTQDRFSWHFKWFSVSAVYYDAAANAPVNMTDSLNTKELYASLDTAYYCAVGTQGPFQTRWTDVAKKNVSDPLLMSQTSVYFGGLIIQAFMNNTAVGFTQFENCEYAFSIGMWMAVVAGGIMGLIASLGISMLVSITAQGRFDNPKIDKLLTVPNE